MVKFVVCPSLNHMFGRNSGSPRQAVVLACSGPGREWGGGGGRWEGEIERREVGRQEARKCVREGGKRRGNALERDGQREERRARKREREREEKGKEKEKKGGKKRV